jgi:hypothetical protein
MVTEKLKTRLKNKTQTNPNTNNPKNRQELKMDQSTVMAKKKNQKKHAENS